MLFIWVILFSKKVANVLATSSSEEFVGKLFFCYLVEEMVDLTKYRALLSSPASEIQCEIIRLEK